MPLEHTSTITHKGTLKSEVRTSIVIYQSDPKSALVQWISVQYTPKSLFLALRSSISVSLRGILEIKVQIQLFQGIKH